MTAIIDYDAGNIRSVENAVRYLGHEAVVTADSSRILSADHVILPGVGAFGDAMEKLRSAGLEVTIRQAVKAGIPFLGICLGLQLLFEESEESPGVKGLCLLPGRIRRIPEGDGRKVPQIGWNALKLYHDHPLFADTAEGDYVYFVHSYYADASLEHVIATTEYGAELTAAVAKDNVIGCQFHPEKSGPVGLKILRRFCAL